MPAIGRSVQFVRTPLVGVPRSGVTNVGLVPNTKDPDPVSSVTAAARFADEGVARNVLIPLVGTVPESLISFTGYPVE